MQREAARVSETERNIVFATAKVMLLAAARSDVKLAHHFDVKQSFAVEDNFT